MGKKKLGLGGCVECFLELVFSYDWEKSKKMPQYREREVRAEIRGYNKAQEHLRCILELNGTPLAAKLGEVRSKGQEQPERIGNLSVWMG